MDAAARAVSVVLAPVHDPGRLIASAGRPRTRHSRHFRSAPASTLRWAVYYEREGYDDPSVDQIRSDLAYIRDFYASFTGYASCPEQPDAWHQYSGSRDANCLDM
jgi:hypothetical protein